MVPKNTSVNLLKSIAGSSLLLWASSCHGSEADKLFEMSFEDLLKVPISVATKTQQESKKAPAVVTLITAKEIRSSGAKTLFELMRLLPGVTPIKQIAAADNLVVRGINLIDGILVLVDGVPANDAFAGSFDYYQRTLDDIERIEVIRGPGSALYGEYAVSAVLSLTTKQAKGDGYKVQLGAGSFNEYRLAVNGSQDFSDWAKGLKVAASFSYLENDGDDLLLVHDHFYTPTPGTFLEPLSNPTLTPTERAQSTESYTGHLKLDWHHWQVGFLHAQVINRPLFSHLALVTEEGKTLRDVNNDRLYLSYSHDFSEQVNWFNRVYWAQYENKLFGQSQPPHFSGDESQDGLNEEWPSGVIDSFYHKTIDSGVESELSWQIAKAHQLLLQGAAKDVEIDDVFKISNATLHDRGPAAVFPTQDLTHQYMPLGVERSVHSFSFQYIYQWLASTSLTLGARYDDYSDFGDTTNPRLALVHQFSSKLFAKLLYGEAFKPPSFFQLFEATPTQTVNRSRGNPNLQPTQIESAEVQVGYKWTPDFEAKINLFNNRTSDEIFYNATPGVQQWQNSGNRRSKGGELDLRGTGLGLDYFWLNYSYQDSSVTDTGAAANIYSKHRFNGLATIKMAAGKSLNLSAHYYSAPDREANDDRGRIAPLWLFGLTYQQSAVLGLELQLAVDNLFDEDGRYPVARGLFIDDDIPVEGRRVRLTLSKEF